MYKVWYVLILNTVKEYHWYFSVFQFFIWFYKSYWPILIKPNDYLPWHIYIFSTDEKISVEHIKDVTYGSFLLLELHGGTVGTHSFFMSVPLPIFVSGRRVGQHFEALTIV